MTEEDIKLIIDMLIYLDVKVNWYEDKYLNNDIGKTMDIITGLQNKHKDIGNAEKRHKIISNLITKLEEELNESNHD